MTNITVQIDWQKKTSGQSKRCFVPLFINLVMTINAFKVDNMW